MLALPGIPCCDVACAQTCAPPLRSVGSRPPLAPLIEPGLPREESPRASPPPRYPELSQIGRASCRERLLVPAVLPSVQQRLEHCPRPFAVGPADPVTAARFCAPTT